ncbi:hypothetical protein V5799_015355 [Amblyomma americanum]|uniref:Tick metalloprotease n=1 Tax=Amblyomma americanum TaxID=6943 RepID=A0AAQ4E0E0_AMBAM
MTTVGLTLVFLSTFFSNVCAAPSSKHLSERIVFPHHLESRADTGTRVVRITDDLVLDLEKTSLFGDEITVVSFDEDGNQKAMTMPGHEAEKDLYHDQGKLAAVHLTHDDGFQVEGVVGPRLRIRPLPAAERSSEGHVAHLLFEVEPKRDSYPADRLQLISRDMNQTEERRIPGLENPQPEARRYGEPIIPEITIFADVPFSKFFSYIELKVQRYIAVMITCVSTFQDGMLF